MISLNIEKTFGFISKEKVSAYEAEVKAAQEMLKKEQEKVTTSWDGYICLVHQQRASG